MKLKSSFFYTLRDDVKDEESTSGNLLVRSGMIKKVGNGIYQMMPLGQRVISKIENIVREEMDKAGAQELVMPSLIPEDFYVQSGRRNVFGHDMFSLKDRYNRDYVLGPTHEELFVNAAKEKVKSYKDLPFNLYQMANKYRDEPRPRYGLIRVREFVMKDAYSFDVDNDGLDISYNKMFNAYKNIFNKLGLDYKIVRASTGAMGGLLSEEFQAVSDIGEDILVLCDNCDYASNIEVSECISEKTDNTMKKEIEKIYTPNIKTIDELSASMNINASALIKTLIYKVDGELIAVIIPGDRELNEDKLQKLLNAESIELASLEEIEANLNTKVGFVGPINLNIKKIMDNKILNMSNFIVGANEENYHLKNVNCSDFEVDIVSDIVNVKEGDICPKCHGKLYFKKGIEVGNTFKLGTKYSKSLGLEYLDNNNQLKPVVMGSYGIGIGRVMAAIVEQNNDESGIIWPYNIAPYKVAIVLINENDEKQNAAANDLYSTLIDNKIETILDDRSVRPGVKFNDMDLIGIPIRIVVGKKINDGMVEIKLRNSNEIKEIKISDVLDEINI